MKEGTRPILTHQPVWKLHPDEPVNARSRARVELNRLARMTALYVG